MLKITT
jgi:hypothetical protein